MFELYEEIPDGKGRFSYAKIGEGSRAALTMYRPSRRRGEKDFHRTLLYRGGEFIASTGW